MSSSATMVVVSSLHVTKSHCCLATLLKLPYTQTRPFYTFSAITRPLCFPPAGALLRVLGLLCLSAAATLSSTRSPCLALFSPVLFCVLDGKTCVSAVGSRSDRSQCELLVSCDGAGSQTSPLEQALPFMPCPAFSPPKQKFLLWQAAARP